MRVYRVVIDSYPTPDGLPFVEQSEEFWEEIVDRWNNPLVEGENPDWVPDLDGWLPNTDDTLFRSVRGGTAIGESYDEFGRSLGPLIYVPKLFKKHYFTRPSAERNAERLREWGAVVHVEMSQQLYWENM